MDKITKNILNKKLMLPFIISIIGILFIIIGMFLPYMTAVGELSDYIESFPDEIISNSYDVTNKDFAKFPFISISKIVGALWGENDAMISTIFLILFGSFAILTTLFILLKKPIVTIIFDLLTCATFLFIGVLLKEDFISADKYAWGIGYFIILIAVAIIFIASILMLIIKIHFNKSQNVLQ